MRLLGWRFLTRLKANRQIRIGAGLLQAVSEAGLTSGDGTLCWLKGFGQIKVFRIVAKDGTSEYWATSLDEVNESERGNVGFIHCKVPRVPVRKNRHNYPALV